MSDNLMNEFTKAKDTYERLLAEKGKVLLASIFTKMFDVDPQIGAFRWTQYTPHFNDGDELVFGVYERSFRAGAKWGDLYRYRTDPMLLSDESYRALKSTDDQLNSDMMTDVFEAAFGDHVKVTATRDAAGVVSFETEECEHD